jgi:hypothetical protein
MKKIADHLEIISRYQPRLGDLAQENLEHLIPPPTIFHSFRKPTQP